MIRLTLEHTGHTVDTAADGQEGLDKFGAGGGYDIVLLDQRMPGLEGVTVLKQMLFHNPDARIIMITAFGTVDLAVEAMRAGATDFLRKPFTAEILRAAVDAALGERGARTADAGPMFGMTTINGYRIEAQLNSGVDMNGDFGYEFTVRSPVGESNRCTVVLPSVVAELVKVHADREEMPGGSRFWQALCEEVLANYLYQNACFPPDNVIPVEDYTPGMKRWVEAVLAV